VTACSQCGAENPSEQRFCGHCGNPLSAACPACGAQNAPGNKFCGSCGTALAGEPTATLVAGGESAEAASVPQPASERRLVSVLFADLVGFTAASEKRDAEETRELLSRYFDTCRRLIELYGGTVEKFIGDAVMAVWGTPTATEDDAERAVRAALDLVTAVSALGDEVGAPELRARAGVLTGEAAVTIGAEGEGMVAGDLVNTASRVQSVAQPGTVYVGDSTRRATEQTIVYESAGSHELQGKGGLYPLYRALRVSKGTVLGRMSRPEESEILLAAALERAVAENLLAAGQRAANNLAAMLESRDALAESQVASARALEISRRIGDRRMERFIRAGRVSADVALGNWDEALAVANDVDPNEAYAAQAALVVEVDCRRGKVVEARERLVRHTAALEVDDPQIRTTYAVCQAIVLRAEGDARQALETAEQALSLGLERIGIRFIGVKLALVEALECAYELSDGRNLEELLGRIESLRTGDRSPLLAAHAARFRAKLEPDFSRAETGFRRAETKFHDLGLVFRLAVTQLEHAERLDAAGRSAEAQPLFEQARETFERLEALPWVERTFEARSEGEPVAVS